MSIWKIHSWSREHARGTIKSSGFPEPLEFDAAVALVDDFSVGEQVEVQLDHGSTTPRVKRIWPQRSRLNVVARLQRPLPEYLAQATERLSRELTNASPDRSLEVTTASTNLIELAIVRSYQTERTVVVAARFARPSYAQLEWRVQTGSHRLSAYRWPAWLQHNREIVEGWSLDPTTVDPSAYVFAIEPLSFGERRVQYIVADDLEVLSGAR